MKKRHLLAAAALVTAAVFPYAKSYVDNLPKQLTKQEAASRYLELSCPSIKINDYLLDLDNKIKKETSLYYWDSNALANANNRVGALETRFNIAQDSLHKTQEKKSKEFLDPKYIWPKEVQKDIKYIAQQDFKEAGEYWLWKKNKVERTQKELDLQKEEAKVYSAAASRVRQELGLPPIGQGCEAK